MASASRPGGTDGSSASVFAGSRTNGRLYDLLAIALAGKLPVAPYAKSAKERNIS